MIYYYTKFQDPILSGASVVPTSQISATTMLLLPISGNKKRGYGVLQGHKVRINFSENRSAG
jgi:hypothetical protein